VAKCFFSLQLGKMVKYDKTSGLVSVQ